MRKLNIKTLVMLLCMAFGFTQLASAQFASSDEVYCYKFVKSVKDGVMSKEAPEARQFFIVIFPEYGIMQGVPYNLSRTISKIAENPNYLDEQYSRLKGYSTKKCAHEKRYVEAFSTSSKYTYRLWWFGCADSYTSMSRGWDKYNELYSFSTDKSEMIYWSLNDDVRCYYKRIDPESLKPNLDFLE